MKLLHVSGVNVEGVKLCGIVGIICTYDGGNARDLQLFALPGPLYSS